MYFITTKRMLEVCFSAHPNIQYRTYFYSYKSNLYLYFFLGYIKRGPHYLILIMCKIQK